MKLLKNLFLFLFIVAPLGAFCATKTVSVPTLESNVRKVQAEVNQLAKSISKLEKDLGSKHGQYLETMKMRQAMESRLLKAQETLSQNDREANERSTKLRMILQRLALQELDQHQSAAAMAAQKLLSAQVNQQLKTLNHVISQSQEKQNELEKLSIRINEYVETEQRLSQLVQTMEEMKKEKADAYLAAMGKKSEVEEQLSALRLSKRRKIVKNVGIAARFSSPIEEFLGVEYDKKGITYKFTGRKPVVATEEGKVAYSGRLSTYGNVILIDHGDETRSVILGQFVPKMNKGQKVSRGDVLGYTENTTTQGKLYFEVRKGDKVLDTIALMDQKFLNKHRITKI